MKKIIYFLALAATLSLAISSCKGKDKKDDGEDEMEDMTYVITVSDLA